MSVGGYFVVGVVAGVLYFCALWWTARRFALGGRMGSTIALTGARFLLLGGLLVLASQHGALALLAVALGVFVARFAVVRRVRAGSA